MIKGLHHYAHRRGMQKRRESSTETFSAFPSYFKNQDRLDLNISPEVEPDTLYAPFAKAKMEDQEVRDIVDHDFVHSIYLRNQMVV